MTEGLRCIAAVLWNDRLETTGFQPFAQQPETMTLPYQYLHPVPAPIHKDKHAAR